MFPASALVTGGSSGIGAALVARLRAGGTRVEVLDLAGGFDVADPAAWERVAPVELACLNAGMTGGERDLVALPLSSYRRVVATNLDGVVLGTRRMAEVMAPGGVIAVTASLAGLVPMASDPVYTLTKHAVIGFVRSVAPQLTARRLHICAVAPGMVDTPLLGAARAELVEAGYPLLTPDEVATALLVAASAAGNGGGDGEVWVVQPGRPPEPMRFPRVPGPRGAQGERIGPPPDA